MAAADGIVVCGGCIVRLGLSAVVGAFGDEHLSQRGIQDKKSERIGIGRAHV